LEIEITSKLVKELSISYRYVEDIAESTMVSVRVDCTEGSHKHYERSPDFDHSPKYEVDNLRLPAILVKNSSVTPPSYEPAEVGYETSGALKA
jgi:hypothetical protein